MKTLKGELIGTLCGTLIIYGLLLSTSSFDFAKAAKEALILIASVWLLRILFHHNFGVAKNSMTIKLLIWVPIIGFSIYFYLSAVYKTIIEYSILGILAIIPGSVLLLYAIVTVGRPLVFGKDSDDD